MTITPALPGPAPLGWRDAVVFVGGALFFCAVAALFLWFALKNHEARLLYEKEAIVTMGTVVGFETFTTQGRSRETFHTLPMVEFNVDGRAVRARLVAARPVFPHQREAWIGRRIELRYPPGSPGRVIASDAIDQLPGMSPRALTWVAAVLLAMAALTFGAWLSLRRGRSKAAPAHGRIG